jgi:hypothetical protein
MKRRKKNSQPKRLLKGMRKGVIFGFSGREGNSSLFDCRPRKIQENLERRSSSQKYSGDPLGQRPNLRQNNQGYA